MFSFYIILLHSGIILSVVVDIKICKKVENFIRSQNSNHGPRSGNGFVDGIKFAT
jgi:hypothetical protein